MHASPGRREARPQDSAGHIAETEFERLYREHHARVYNLAARIVGDRDDAADITQEVFLRAYSHSPGTSYGRSVEPWLYRVAVNASYDHLRRRAARPAAPLDAVPEPAATGDGFALAETTRLVERCLAGLTPRYRTVLVLKDLHGLSNAEIADVMDLRQGTTRVLLHRARAAFRRAFRAAAPAGAGGASTLGLAAFLPDLPVPVSLQTPPWAHLGPAAGGPATACHPLPPAAGAGQAALPVAAPAAAIPVAAVPGVSTGIPAGLGSVAGLKAVVAVVAVAAVTAGGAAVGHHAETADPQARGPGGDQTTGRTTATDAPASTRTHGALVRGRLGVRGFGTEAGGDRSDARAQGRSGDGPHADRHRRDGASGADSAARAASAAGRSAGARTQGGASHNSAGRAGGGDGMRSDGGGGASGAGGGGAGGGGGGYGGADAGGRRPDDGGSGGGPGGAAGSSGGI